MTVFQKMTVLVAKRSQIGHTKTALPAKVAKKLNCFFVS
jgi:hypothetical protein